MSFFDEFNHIVPYTIKFNVGKNRPFITDATKKNSLNHKGKMVPFYKRAKTLEEMEKYGIGEYTEYMPAEEVSMPIDIQINSNEELIPVFEESSKFTFKKSTEHSIRLFNSNKCQVGYVTCSLTPSGDIDHKTSFYESPDGNEQIRHIIYNEFEDGVIVRDDFFGFKQNCGNITKKVEITQRNGKIVGSSVLEQELETDDDVRFQSITQFSKDENTPKLKKYVASCVVDESEHRKRGGTLIPWECLTLEYDLLEYQKRLEEFQRFSDRFKERTGRTMSIKKAIELGKLSFKELEMEGISPVRINIWYYSKIAKYLADENNNLLKDFKGKYIGNILNLTDKGYEACIVTKHQKDEQDYRIYTLIDFTGTSITQGTGMDQYEEIKRETKYLERLRNSDKTPTFITKISKDGKEELVLHSGKAVSGECPEYDEFVEKFISPFSEIKPIQISKFLNKKSEKDR